MGWFRENLPIPDWFSNSPSKGHHRRDTKELSWFREDAEAMINAACELLYLLSEHGYPIDVLRSDRVGYVIYQDACQIGAEPYVDMPT